MKQKQLLRTGKDGGPGLLAWFTADKPFYLSLSVFRYKRVWSEKEFGETVPFAVWFGYHRFVNQIGEGWDCGLCLFGKSWRFRKVTKKGMEKLLGR